MLILLMCTFCPFADPSFGVEESRLHGGEGGRDRYFVAGREVPRAAALQAIGGPAWPDATRWRVTVIGEGRDAVLRDFASHPALAPWRDRCLVRGYDPAHWHLAPGFVTTGKPTVYVQSADGLVLHRQDDYAGGPEALARALEAMHNANQLRKPSPDYKPEADRDLRRRLFPATRLPWSVLVGGGLALLAVILLWRKA